MKVDRLYVHTKRWWNVHRLLPGGVLGRRGEYAGVFALLSTPQDELWVSIAPAVSYLIEGVWHTHPADETLVYRDTRWQRFANSANSSPRRLVWYRDAIWGVDLRANNLVVCDGHTWQLVTPLPFADPWSLAVDPAGYLWVGTQGDGLWRTADTKHWERMALPHYRNPHQRSFVTALHCPHADTILVAECDNVQGTSTICQYVYGYWNIVPLPPRPRTFRSITALTVDPTGGIWLGLTPGGVWSWNGQVWHRHPSRLVFDRPGVPGSGIISFHIDQKQRLWVVTSGGVGYYEHRKWYTVIVALEPPTTDREVPSWLWPTQACHLTCCHLDSSGRLWIGTHFGEVAWIDTTHLAYADPETVQFSHYRPQIIQVDEEG
jgi:hypothetical protein